MVAANNQWELINYKQVKLIINKWFSFVKAPEIITQVYLGPDVITFVYISQSQYGGYINATIN